MAITTGLVQRISLFDAGACVFIGPTEALVNVLSLAFQPGDSAATRASKRAMLAFLVKAKMAGYQVRVSHSDTGSAITGVASVPVDISPIGPAIHEDFYAVSGAGIPDDAVIVFDSPAVTVSVTPDLIRPHVVVVAQLPSAIPLGQNTVTLQAAGWGSDAVPVEVVAGPRATVRVLFSGDPKPSPYSIPFVGNPAIARDPSNGTGFYADPVLTNRQGFHDGVGFCLNNILLSTEDLLRRDDLDAHIRFVAVFDATVAAADASALAKEYLPNIIETRRDKLNGYLAGYYETPDVVYVMSASTTFTRASAWFTTDDMNRATVAFTYDGVNRMHGRYPSIPGSTAVPITAGGLTALHEFGHAASDFSNGMVSDLYVDGVSGFSVNKKARALNTDPVPANFATHQGTNFASDQNRDGLGYPALWTSYHPQLIDATRPNMMDNYWFATNPPNPRTCRLDRLTYDWFRDRLRAKVFR